MQLFTTSLLLLLAVHQTQSKKREKANNSGEEDGKKADDMNPVIDRLAMNLAGAFVKSIFPESEPSTKAPASPVNIQEIRRAPSGVFDLTSSGQNGLYSSIQNPFPNIGAVPGVSTYTTGGGLYRTDLPASYIYPFGQPGQSVTLTGGAQPFGLGRESLGALAQGISSIPLNPILPPPENIEAINRYRKEQYFADLQRHQQELSQYTAKQMEYLDQQRKYQQTMLDHQAGAALLMQQQQQELLNKRMKLASHGELPSLNQLQPTFENDDSPTLDQQTGGQVLQNARSKDLSKQFAARTQLENAFPNRGDDREEYASDDYLRKFFKDNYGIDINENLDGKELTEEERSTLKELKDHLIQEAKGDGIKYGALKTLDKYKNKIKTRKPFSYSTEKQGEVVLRRNLYKRHACEKCVPIQLERLTGSWTQIYGNPTALRRIYSTILSLQSLDLRSSMVTTSLTSKRASCVGFQIKKTRRRSSIMHLYFRDDTKLHELHEMNGKILNETNGVLELELSKLNSALCLVKAGPAEQYLYDYVVLAETEGVDKCRSYHIFARNIEQFKRQYYDDISDFMKMEVVEENILPVAGLPKPHYCEVKA